MPRVSVIIPTYNRAQFVKLAIDSVLAQTYADYEVIVVDDGSTDGTEAVLQGTYGTRIAYERQDNQGAAAARNRGIALSTGEFVAFLDSDDIWLPGKLERQLALHTADSQTVLSFTQAWRIDAHGYRDLEEPIGSSVTHDSLSLERLCLDNCIASPTLVVVSRSALETAGGFDTSIRHCEDWDLWLRLQSKGLTAIVAEPLALIRRHRGGLCHYPSREENASRRENLLATLRKLFAHWPEAPPELRDRAFAWVYAYSAIQEMAVGNELDCRNCLERVVDSDPSLLADSQRFGAAIVSVCALMYDRNDTDRLSPSLLLVRRMLGAVAGTGCPSRTFERLTRARAYEALGYTAMRSSDPGVARECFVRALALEPALVRNRGMMSLLFEATLGKRASAWRKGLWRRLRALRPAQGD